MPYYRLSRESSGPQSLGIILSTHGSLAAAVSHQLHKVEEAKKMGVSVNLNVIIAETDKLYPEAASIHPDDARLIFDAFGNPFP